MPGISGPGRGRGLMRPILFLLCSGVFWLGWGRGGGWGAVLQFFGGDFRFPGGLGGGCSGRSCVELGWVRLFPVGVINYV